MLGPARVPLVLLLLHVVPALAAGDPNEEAKIHFKSGESYYNRGDWATAMREFEESYALSKKGALLFNIGLCREKLGDWRAAAEALRAYLVVPESAHDRVMVSEKLKRLDELVKQQEDAQKATAPLKVPEAPPVTEPPPDPHRYRKVGWSIVGVGAGALLGSLVTGLIAHNHYGSLANACGDSAMDCPADFAASRDTGRSLALASDVLLGVGVAAALVGVVLVVVKVKDRPVALAPAAPTAIAPSSRGLVTVVSW